MNCNFNVIWSNIVNRSTITVYHSQSHLGKKSFSFFFFFSLFLKHFYFNSFCVTSGSFVAWMSFIVVNSVILVHPSAESCTLYLICSFLSLFPTPNLPLLSLQSPLCQCMPLSTHSLVPTYKWEHTVFGLSLLCYFS